MKEYIDFSNGPLPYTEDNEGVPFWEGTRQGEIRFPKCQKCHKYNWYPTVLCPYCQSDDIKWEKLTSQPRLYTWSDLKVSGPMWNVGTYHGVKSSEEVRIVALVEYEEAPQLFLATNLVECTPQDVYIGMPLEVVFQRVNDEVTMPLFRPLKKKTA